MTLGKDSGEIHLADGQTVLPVKKRNGVYELHGKIISALGDEAWDPPSSGGALSSDAAMAPPGLEAGAGEGASEIARPKMLTEPHKPTEAEVREHEVLHLPHRSWCKFCVRARGRPRGHAATGRSATGVPRLSIDYMFAGQRVDLRPLTGLSLKDEARGAVKATVVPAKGTQQHTYPAVWLAECIRLFGYPEVMLKSDGEPAILDLKHRAKSMCTEVKVNLEVTGEWRDRGDEPTAGGTAAVLERPAGLQVQEDDRHQPSDHGVAGAVRGLAVHQLRGG